MIPDEKRCFWTPTSCGSELLDRGELAQPACISLHESSGFSAADLARSLARFTSRCAHPKIALTVAQSAAAVFVGAAPQFKGAGKLLSGAREQVSLRGSANRSQASICYGAHGRKKQADTSYLGGADDSVTRIRHQEVIIAMNYLRLSGSLSILLYLPPSHRTASTRRYHGQLQHELEALRA